MNPVTPDKPAPLAPLDERTIEFHGDHLTAVLALGEDGQPTVYVPVRPLVEHLGLAWPPQYQRIRRDPVLSDASKGVIVTVTPSGERRRVAGDAVS